MQIIYLLRKYPVLHKTVVTVREYMKLLMSKLIDQMLNIDTISLPVKGVNRDTRFHDSVVYVGVPYLHLWKCIRQLKPQRNDVVFDIGCGMGRMLCCFALKKIKKCVGVEISEVLAEKARQNAISMKNRKCPIEIHVCDAVNACYSEGTMYCLYDPFGPKTLEAVLERIESSVKKSPRHIWVAYFHPIHDAVLQSCGWLRCYKHKYGVLSESGWFSLYTNKFP